MTDARLRTAHWLKRLLVKGIERRHWARLVERCPDPDAIARHGKRWLCEVGGLGPEVAERLVEGASDDEVRAELDLMERFGARLLTRFDDGYPSLLRQMAVAPVALYVVGDLYPDDDLAVALVGPRKPSPYGREMARRLAGDFARAGLTVVSGFAVGVDAAAHRAALEAGGRTLGVLGCGLNIKYPYGNSDLRRHMLEEGSGALISEYPMSTPPLPGYFPPRNQIIAGLSQAVVVVEAAQRSGALVTARAAVEENRHVYAVPADVTRSTARGSNALLRAGAMPLLGAEDLLEDLGPMLQGIARQLEQEGKLQRPLALDPPAPIPAPTPKDQATPSRTDIGAPPTPSDCSASNTQPRGDAPGALASDPVSDPDARLLHERIARDPMIDLDTLMAELIPDPFTMGRLTSLLLRLELAGMVRQLPGRCYIAR